jgi:5-methyltetrahydropteroyltriglutamate--homocysteine methyltransferase
MRRSETRILTTHVGSLPFNGKGPPANEAEVRAEVAAALARQREAGLDIVNEGEHTKGGDWLSYVDDRFAGFEERPRTAAPLIAQGLDRETFADFYAWASRRGSLFFTEGGQMATARPQWTCVAPVAYAGGDQLAREIAIFREALAPGEEGFLTATAPASIEVYRENAFYESEEAYVFALAEALRVEYEAIVAAGFLLQVDDAWLPALWDRIGVQMGLAAFKRRSAIRIEALNHAFRNIPEDRIRYHLCWGSWHGPHAFDIGMDQMADLMLGVKAQAYLFEAGNVRHEHEYEVWDQRALPAGKILVPGVVSHATDIVEHPQAVAQRLRRFAERVGPENIMAGTDCGFGGRSHPQIAWAKLKSLTEGAALASKGLF